MKNAGFEPAFFCLRERDSLPLCPARADKHAAQPWPRTRRWEGSDLAAPASERPAWRYQQLAEHQSSHQRHQQGQQQDAGVHAQLGIAVEQE